MGWYDRLVREINRHRLEEAIPSKFGQSASSEVMLIVVRCIGCLFFLLLVGALSPVFGKDLNTLIHLLYSAYVAEQGSAMCMVPSIKLSDSDRAVFIDAHNYAQLVKQKVSAGLNDDDVRFVLKSAADRAREDMLRVVRVLKSNPPDDEYAELFRWCTNNMKPAAEKLLRAYADAPDALDKIIENAKHE